MSSRGASGRQLLRLAALEAAGVALVTTLVSPWLAGLLFQAITSLGPLAEAGLHHDPGRPPTLWITCAVASFVLAGVLLGPLLRRRGSVVDAEQQLVRQDRRGGLARSGADLALLVLAGSPCGSCRAYRSPVVDAGSGRLDPVLVVAPALLLLAGAVLALRLLPLVARAGERMAARSRVARLARSPRGRSVGARVGPQARCSCSPSRWRSARSPSPSSAPGGRPRATRWTSPWGPTCGWTAWTAPASRRRAPSTVCRTCRPPARSRSGRSTSGTPPTAPARAAAGRSTCSRSTPRRRTRCCAAGSPRPGAPSRHRCSPTEPATGHRAARRARPASWSTSRAPVRPPVDGRPAGQPRRRGPARAPAPRWSCRPIPLVGTTDDVAAELPATAAGLQLVGVVAQILARATSTPTACSVGPADVRLDVVVRRPARRRTTRGSHRGHRHPGRAHRRRLDRAGRAAGERQPAPAGRSGPTDEALRVTGADRPVRGPVRPLRVRRGDVPRARPRPGRRDRHARGGLLRRASATSSTSTSEAPGSRSSSTGWSPTCPVCPPAPRCWSTVTC